jgi:hypothetical protein
MTDSSERLSAWVDPLYDDPTFVARLHNTFVEADAVHLPELLPELAHAALTTAAGALHDQMHSRAFVMPVFGTPRVMSVLGARSLVPSVPMVRELYQATLPLVQRIVGAPVYPCTHPEESTVLNRLDGRCATHGWHRDDPAFALTIVLIAPPAGTGGVVEYLPRWQAACAHRGITPDVPIDAGVEVLRADGLVRAIPLSASDAYLLRADTSLHRVTPLLCAGTSRVVLSLAFQDSLDTQYEGTADLLYG